MTLQAITSQQKKQFKRFVEDACDRVLENADLDKNGLQKLLERGGEFQSRIVTAVQELSVSNQYAGEEVASSYGYLSGYEPKSIAEQVEVLRELFPELGSIDEGLAEADLPANAEGWFAIPRWEKIADTYGEAVDKVLALLSKTRGGRFHNYRQGQLGSRYLRQHERTVVMLERFGEAQSDHDILVVPAQFGLMHRGRSVRRAREVFKASEFGLGAFQIVCMLLTHPERLQHLNDLWIDCAGDEFSPGGDGDFSGAPCINFDDGGVGFGTHWVGSARGDYGSGSGFLPQS